MIDLTREEYEIVREHCQPLTDDALYQEFDRWLNDCYGTVKIAGLEYNAGYALREIDPVAYRCGFNDWLDGEISGGYYVEYDGQCFDTSDVEQALKENEE